VALDQMILDISLKYLGGCLFSIGLLDMLLRIYQHYPLML